MCKYRFNALLRHPGYNGSSDSSSSSSATTTTNVDKRLVVSSGVGVSSDSSTVNVTSTSMDPAIAQAALDTVKANDATNGASFSALLTMADKMFTEGGNILQQQSQATMAQVGAIGTLANDQKGAIDQKTLIILAVAGVAAITLRKK